MEPLQESRSITGVFMPRLIARLHREGFDGTLRLHAGGATRVIYFRRGDIASAASNAEEDRLHNLLISEGRLTGPQVEMARSRQRPGASLGKVLIELGFLTPSELLQGARRQVRQILAACFALTEGSWQSVPGPLGPEVTNLGLPVRRLIFDALMEAGDRSAIVREMGSMESIYQPTASFSEALPTLRLEPAMDEVARMIDGRATLREISSRTRLDDFTVSRIVLAFDILGLAALVNHPEPAIAGRPGRVIPVENDDDSAAEVVVRPVEPAARADSPPGIVAVVPPAPEPQRQPGPRMSRDTAPGSPSPREEGRETIRLSARSLPVSPPPAGDREMPLPGAEETAPAPWSGTASPGPSSTAPADDGMALAEDEEEPAAQPAARPEAEPPSFPREELPAFADEPVEREETPVWTINPETGEKVHEGPIELTFDGPLTPARSGRPRTSLIVAAGLAAVVIGVVAVTFYMRSQAGESARMPLDGAGDVPVTTATAQEPASPDAVPVTPTGSGGEPAADDAADTAGEQDGPPVEPPAPVAQQPATAVDIAAAPPPGDIAGTTGGPKADLPPPSTPGSADPRLAAGQALLDDGDMAGAAAAFHNALAALPADSLSLQLMIACEEATVRKARASSSPDDPLFMTPFTLQGRSCHRILWGIYPDRAAALAGVATLPPYFTTAGIKPVAVSIARLRGPS